MLTRHARLCSQITAKEINDYLSKAGVSRSHVDCLRLMSEFDSSGDGKLDMMEFCGALAALPNPRAASAFGTIDGGRRCDSRCGRPHVELQGARRRVHLEGQGRRDGLRVPQ